MKRKTGSKLLIYSKTVETSYLRDLLVAVVSVEPWELRAFMVPINRPFGQYEINIIFHFLISSYAYISTFKSACIHVCYKILFPKK